MIAGKLSEYAQLDLRIVGNDQPSPFRITGETASILDRMRHLLNVRIGTRKPARRRSYLSKVSMQTFRYGIDQFDHVFSVTRQSLLHGAVFEQRANDWILRGEWL
jgi:hypothetical protein